MNLMKYVCLNAGLLGLKQQVQQQPQLDPPLTADLVWSDRLRTPLRPLSDSNLVSESKVYLQWEGLVALAESEIPRKYDTGKRPRLHIYIYIYI